MGAKSIVICEGVFDVISTWQAFNEDPAMKQIVPVATFGKHLSMKGEDSQLTRLLDLKRMGLKVITLMWDGEKQAIQDACRTANQLIKYGFKVRIARLPGKDPNELPAALVRNTYWEAQYVEPKSITELLLTTIRR